MQRTHHGIASLVGLVACALLTLGATAQAQDKKADPTGTWKWTTPSQNNGQPRASTLKLKLEGDKLTGTYTSSGRQGGQPTDTAIEDGKLKGDEISFRVTREFNGNKFVSKYNGKISGDSIKGKIESDRGGETQTRDWDAKREAAK
jgi:hypothetical protein